LAGDVTRSQSRFCLIIFVVKAMCAVLAILAPTFQGTA
jgi:hypothetical protein